MKRAIHDASRVLRGGKKSDADAASSAGGPSTDDFLSMLRAKEQQLADAKRENATLRRMASETEADLFTANGAIKRMQAVRVTGADDETVKPEPGSTSPSPVSSRLESEHPVADTVGNPPYQLVSLHIQRNKVLLIHTKVAGDRVPD
jgi:hypothetical protein